MADLSKDWEAAKPISLQADWDSAAPTNPTATERGQAAVGGVNRGIAGLVGLPVDTAENLVNLGLAGVGTAANAFGRPDLAPSLLRASPGTSEWIREKFSKVGIGTTNPRPDDPASRMLHTGGMIAGGSMVPGAGVKGTLAAATGGAVAGETLGPEWVGVGAIAPAAIGQGIVTAKNALAARTAPNVEMFKQAGTTPSVGQATDSVFFRGIENLAAKFPGGAGIIKKFVDSQQGAFGARARTGVTAEDAGRAIERGITGEKGFVTRFKSTQDKLYGELDKHIPSYRAVKVDNTVKALDDLNQNIEGAPNLSAFFKNKRMMSMESALTKDLDEVSSFLENIDRRTGALPYEAVKKLRTLVGRELADSTIVSDVPRSKWKALYGALSDDLGIAAKEQGPEAVRTWSRANNYSRTGMDRIESVLNRVLGKNRQPEDIFKVIDPKDREQVNMLRSTMRSLDPGQRQVVSEAVVNRLGRVAAGKQDFYGNQFSSETFLTNWNKLSPGARAQLFPDAKMRQNIEQIAKAASTIREGAGLYANPSGTAGSFAAYSVYASPIAAIAAGDIAPVVAAGGAMGSAYIGARMLTNPRIVEWMATPINPGSAQAAVHLARLGVIYNDLKDRETKDELAKFMESLPK